MLPKMVFALVAVNFSWAACVFMVDVSNVATAVVLSVPQSLRENQNSEYAQLIFENCSKDSSIGKTATNKSTGVDFCNPQIKKFLEEKGLTDGDGKMKPDVKLQTLISALEGLDELKFESFTENDNVDANAIIYLMAFGLQDVGNLMNNDLNITSLQELTLDSFFGIILMIVYFIVLIALFVVLLARALMIWLIIAFSPLWALKFVLGDKLGFGGDM